MKNKTENKSIVKIEDKTHVNFLMCFSYDF